MPCIILYLWLSKYRLGEELLQIFRIFHLKLFTLLLDYDMLTENVNKIFVNKLRIIGYSSFNYTCIKIY